MWGRVRDWLENPILVKHVRSRLRKQSVFSSLAISAATVAGRTATASTATWDVLAGRAGAAAAGRPDDNASRYPVWALIPEGCAWDRSAPPSRALTTCGARRSWLQSTRTHRPEEFRGTTLAPDRLYSVPASTSSVVSPQWPPEVLSQSRPAAPVSCLTTSIVSAANGSEIRVNSHPIRPSTSRLKLLG